MEFQRDLLELVDLSDWIEEYAEIKRVNDSEIRVRTCPECLNDKYKLYVNTELLCWFCQRCSWGRHLGNFFLLLAKISDRHINDVRIEFNGMVRPAAELTLEEFVGLSESGEEEETQLVCDLPGEPSFAGMTGTKALEYLRSRGVDQETVEAFGLRLAAHLKEDQFGPWIVFPVIYDGLPVAYQGRRFMSKAEPKYLSSSNIHDWLWPLNTEHLKTFEKEGFAVIVEGVFDALAYWKIGIPAICTFGKNLSNNQIKFLKAHNINTLYLSYDADAYKDISKTCRSFGHLFDFKIIELTPLPEDPKADPGDVLAGNAPVSWLLDAFNNAISGQGPEFDLWSLEKEMK